MLPHPLPLTAFSGVKLRNSYIAATLNSGKPFDTQMNEI
jgi:hypothetical protein